MISLPHARIGEQAVHRKGIGKKRKESFFLFLLGPISTVAGGSIHSKELVTIPQPDNFLVESA
jgi:hypothetical protein